MKKKLPKLLFIRFNSEMYGLDKQYHLAVKSKSGGVIYTACRMVVLLETTKLFFNYCDPEPVDLPVCKACNSQATKFWKLRFGGIAQKFHRLKKQVKPKDDWRKGDYV